jgi:hypothetical protein
MRMIAVLGALLLLLAEVSMACVVVESPPAPSSRNARMVVSLDGKPAGDVRLTVHLQGNQAPRLLYTDSDGTAMLKDLPMGTSCVTAIGKNNLGSRLCLAVAAGATNKMSFFNMTISVMPSWFLSPKEKVDDVEQLPPTTRMRSLIGTVVDPVGAVIPNAEVQVYRRGTYPQSPVKILNTTAEGRFEDSFEPGIYTIIIRMRSFGRWFRSEVIGVEIAPGGSETELRQTLQVGSDCDW